MKKAVVIGGAGHIGSYLVPKLVNMGYSVSVISRGTSKPYSADLPEWDNVEFISCDRKEMVEKCTFGKFVCDMKPDLICDLISFTMEDAKDLCEAMMADENISKNTMLVWIGTIWIYGYKQYAPVDEDHQRKGITNYGRRKDEIEKYIIALAREGKIKATVLHPGHISGRGWLPLNPQGNLDVKVYQDIISGREILLPDDGNAMLHHVHSDDIARMVEVCIDKPDAAIGEYFNIVSPKAVTFRGFAEKLYEAYGHEPKIKYMPFEEMKKDMKPEDVKETIEHMSHSPSCSMEKAKRILDFEPIHSSVDTVLDALDWQIKENPEFIKGLE